MFGFLKKKKQIDSKNQLLAVADGKVIPIEDVKDPVFSGKLMGDGVAVVPAGTTVVAPCAGKISMIAETAHAFGMECENGLEILVHIGIDTVSLGGRGFSVLVKSDDTVTAGTPVITFDRAVMDEAGLDMTIPMIVLENGGKQVEMRTPAEAKAGVTVVMECK